MTVPADARFGVHQGALWLDGGDAHSTLPVSVVVAARLGTEALVFGGSNSTTPYENGTVGGFFSWTARAYDGDWRRLGADRREDDKSGGTQHRRQRCAAQPRYDPGRSQQ